MPAYILPEDYLPELLEHLSHHPDVFEALLYVAHFNSHFTLDEIAAELEISRRALKRRLDRAKLLCEEHLQVLQSTYIRGTAA